MKTPFGYRVCCALSLLCLLVGCQTTFPPMPAEADYTVQKIGSDSFLIYYEGEGMTSEDRIVDFALLRACHLAQEHGFKYFAVLNRGRAGNDGSVLVREDLYQDLKDGMVIRGFTSRPERLFVFKPATLERMIRSKYVEGQGEARLRPDGMHRGT